MVVKKWTRSGDLLSQLGVDGQHLWMADKGEGQDWDGVGCLKAKHTKGQQGKPAAAAQLRACFIRQHHC